MITTTKNNWTYAVFGGVASAALLLAGFFSPVFALTLSNMCLVPLLMVALTQSHVGAMIGTISGAVFMFVLMHFDANLNTGIAMLFLFLVGVPAIVIGHFALLSRDVMGRTEWYPIGQVLVWLVAASFALYTTFYLATNSPDNNWTTELQNEIVKYLSAQLPPEQQLPVEELQSFVASLLPYLPGIIVGLLIITVVVNAIVAQWVLAKMKLNYRPTPSMADLDLPNWTPILIAVLGLIAAFAGGFFSVWAVNMLFICVVPLGLAGLSVIHLLVAQSPLKILWLGLVYIAVVLSGTLAFLPILLLSCLGLAEQWLELRKRALRTS